MNHEDAGGWAGRRHVCGDDVEVEPIHQEEEGGEDPGLDRAANDVEMGLHPAHAQHHVRQTPRLELRVARPRYVQRHDCLPDLVRHERLARWPDGGGGGGGVSIIPLPQLLLLPVLEIFEELLQMFYVLHCYINGGGFVCLHGFRFSSRKINFKLKKQFCMLNFWKECMKIGNCGLILSLSFYAH